MCPTHCRPRKLIKNVPTYQYLHRPLCEPEQRVSHHASSILEVRPIALALDLMTSRTGISPAPFIVGVGRSGTTLLRLMLDAHSDMCIPPEAGFIPAASTRSCNASDPRHEFFRVTTQFETWDAFNLSPHEFHEELKIALSMYPRGSAKASCRRSVETPRSVLPSPS